MNRAKIAWAIAAAVILGAAATGGGRGAAASTTQRLAVAWQRAIAPGAARLIAGPSDPSVLLVEPDGTGALALDGETGVVRWRAAAAPDVVWKGLALGGRPPSWALLDGTSADGRRLTGTVVELGDGQIRWHRVLDAPPLVSADRTGLGLYRHCGLRPLDPTTGALRGAWIMGHVLHVHPLPGRASRPNPFGERCSQRPLLLGDTGSATVMGSFGDRLPSAGPFTLFAAGPDHPRTPPRWSLEVGPIDHGLSIDARSGVLWGTHLGHTKVFALDMATGRLRWSRSFAAGPACPTRTVEVRGVAAGALRLLVEHDCNQASLLDAQSGDMLWQRAVGDARVVVLGETPTEPAVPFAAAVWANAFAGKSQDVLWLTLAGDPAGRVVLFPNSHAMPLGDRLLVDAQTELRLYDSAGKLRWQRPWLRGTEGLFYALGGILVVRRDGVGTTPSQNRVIRLDDGVELGRLGELRDVLGVVAPTPGSRLLLVVAAAPDRVEALRLPGPPRPR